MFHAHRIIYSGHLIWHSVLLISFLSTETERMLLEQKNRNDDLTKKNTKLKTELQGEISNTSVVNWRFLDLVFLLVHKSTEKATGLSIPGFDHVTRGLLISMTVVIAVFVSVKVAV